MNEKAEDDDNDDVDDEYNNDDYALHCHVKLLVQKHDMNLVSN